MTEENVLTPPIDEDDCEPDEYTVEDIRAKRRNPKTGGTEYLIKWQDYPESQNTWEPQDNLKCPDIILRFNEQEKLKRKRRRVTENRESQTKRPKKTDGADSYRPSTEPLLIEDDTDIGSTTETISSSCSILDKTKDHEVGLRYQPKGFERGLIIERIVGSCTDEQDKLWFFIKWKGLNELELIDANELEEKAPREMCSWYRERLYYTIKNPTEIQMREQISAQ